jgi:hypothetical protein
MMFLLPMTVYSIFGLGVSIGVWIGDEDALDAADTGRRRARGDGGVAATGVAAAA